MLHPCLQNLSRRGLHATSLESCKLLLALDPADPMGALFLADYLALRAQDYEWLARMDAEWNAGGGGEDGEAGALGMLPNYAFSLALAAFRQEQDAAGDCKSRSLPKILYPASLRMQMKATAKVSVKFGA